MKRMIELYHIGGDPTNLDKLNWDSGFRVGNRAGFAGGYICGGAIVLGLITLAVSSYGLGKLDAELDSSKKNRDNYLKGFADGEKAAAESSLKIAKENSVKMDTILDIFNNLEIEPSDSEEEMEEVSK